MTRDADDQIILDAIAKWLARDVAPHASKMEHDDIYPTAMVAQMKELGLFGATEPLTHTSRIVPIEPPGGAAGDPGNGARPIKKRSRA